MDSPAPDSEIQITATGTAHYTEAFPAPDKLVAMFVTEDSTGGGSNGTLTVTPQHSNDGGRNWIDKSNLTLSSSTVTNGAVSALFGADDGSTPNMRLMRLKLSVTNIKPYIRIFLSGRSY